MSVWRFFDYIEVGKSVIEEWINGLSPDTKQGVKAQLNVKLLQMRGMRKWPEKLCSAYRGYDDIYELRIPWKKVQYRPLGCYGPRGRFHFTLLVGAIERNNRIPHGDLERAVERMKIIRALSSLDPRYVREHRYD